MVYLEEWPVFLSSVQNMFLNKPNKVTNCDSFIELFKRNRQGIL
jgi:hypothetical protein